MDGWEHECNMTKTGYVLELDKKTKGDDSKHE